VSAFQEQIAERERELAALEELKSQVEAMELRPSELRGEIEQLRAAESEHLAQSHARYTNAFQPYVEARDAAVALVPQLAEALEKALDKRADLEAAYRSLVALGVEPNVAKPDRVEVIQSRDRDLQNEFVRLQRALAGRF
jgi:DNA repair exonuclease SbcCD ATPase subunit